MKWCSIHSSQNSMENQNIIAISTSQHTHTHTHPFNGPLSGTTRVSRYQKGKTNMDFTEARDSEWQWHQLGHMQVCTSLQTDNHASTPPLSFLQAGCLSCHPTNSVKALKANSYNNNRICIAPAFSPKLQPEAHYWLAISCPGRITSTTATATTTTTCI